ncbi:MAG: hypothetical protein PHE63_00235 [Eubacteriales bacterium]|nr:hypothetical protein [Eubacteriales bacterium]
MSNLLDLGALKMSILVNNEDAIKQLKETGDETENVAKKSGISAKKIGRGIAVAGASVVTGTAAAVGGLASLASKTADAGDRVDKMSQRLGLSRQSFQEWDYILSQSGVSIDSMQTGMKQLTKVITDESENSAEMLGSLGLELEDIQGMSQEDAFNSIVTAFQGLEEGAEKARLAQEIFGKQGQEMLPLLNGQAGSIDELRQAANDLGMVMSDDAVNSSVEFADGLDTIKRTAGGLVNQVGAGLMPIITDLFNTIIAALPAIQPMITTLASTLGSFLAQILPVLLELGTAVLPVLLDLFMVLLNDVFMPLAPVIMQIISELLPPLTELLMIIIQEILIPILPMLTMIIKSVLPMVIVLIQAVIQAIQPFLPILMELIQALLPPLIELFTALTPAINFLIAVLVKLVNFAVQKLAPVFKTVFSGIGSLVSDTVGLITRQIDRIKTILSNIISFVKNVFTGNWKGAWDNIKNIFANIFGGLGDLIKTPLNAVIKAVNSMIGGLNKFKINIPSWVPVMGGKQFGFSVPKIPMLAEGGITTAPMHAIIGEAGQEAVIPLDKLPSMIMEGLRGLTGIGNSGEMVKIEQTVNNYTPFDLRNNNDNLARDIRGALVTVGLR